MPEKHISHDAARRFYNSLGTRLDSQAFYEQSGIDELIRCAAFDDTHAVFEFGCGTGRLANQLLEEILPADCRYTAVDISENMVAITQQRLAQWHERVRVTHVTGGPHLDYANGSFDRFVSTFVFDLLGEADAIELTSEAWRVLQPGGLICLLSITHGVTAFSRLLMGSWSLLGKASPFLVGGCRPIELPKYLKHQTWKMRHVKTLSRFGVAMQVVVAERT